MGTGQPLSTETSPQKLSPQTPLGLVLLEPSYVQIRYVELSRGASGTGTPGTLTWSGGGSRYRGWSSPPSYSPYEGP